MRVVFSNIEQILAASTEFLKDLREYQNSDSKTLSLGDICRKNVSTKKKEKKKRKKKSEM